MVKYRPPTKKPCSDCPFRPDALQGWLGDGTPESFIACIQREEPLPCHQSIDYTDPKWKEKWVAGEIGKTCAGGLIMTANMCKLPRDPEFPRMQADRTAVFPHHRAFLDYHNAAPVKSWLFNTESPSRTQPSSQQSETKSARPRRRDLGRKKRQ